MAVALTLLALLIEATVGYPERLLRAIGHPVTWIGRLIGLLDRTLNHESMSDASRRAAGVAAVLILIVVVAGRRASRSSAACCCCRSGSWRRRSSPAR